MSVEKNKIVDRILLKKIVLWAVLLSPVIYVSACACISENKKDAFELIAIGDTQIDVIAKLGNPSVREKPEVLFSRYASRGCQNSCAERLWYENRLNFDMEAWSIDIGKDNRVIGKAHWVSP